MLAQCKSELETDFKKQLEMYCYQMRQAEGVNQGPWRTRRDACLTALTIANPVLSKYGYENGAREATAR